MSPSVKLPLISVVTVCRNSAATLARAFDSILQQSYSSTDYIAIDGASTDGTVEIMRQHEARFAAKGIRFRWISEKDDGIYDAMNKGIAMAAGEIIGIMNSDDFYEPDTLSNVAESAVSHPAAGILYGFLRDLVGGEELRIYRYRYENYLLNKKMGMPTATQHATCFVRRSVYEEVGKFDPRFPTASDYDFLLRAIKAGVRFHALDKVLSNFNYGGASTTISDLGRLEQQYAILLKNNMLTEREARTMGRQLKYRRYKTLKGRIMRWLVGE